MAPFFKALVFGALGGPVAIACALSREDSDPSRAAGTVRQALSSTEPALSAVTPAIPVSDFPRDQFCIHHTLDGKCIFPSPADEDGDGFPKGVDCNDNDPYAYPGAHDAPCNFVDENCDGADFCPSDLDGDGFAGPSDCDDRNPNRNPNAVEIPCNGVDEDCDGADWCDRDQDGEPATVDCNDRDATISHHAKEITCNGIDENCDGVDCCANDDDGDGAPCSADCDDHDPNTYPGAPVTPGCHRKDIDCDGTIDGMCH